MTSLFLLVLINKWANKQTKPCWCFRKALGIERSEVHAEMTWSAFLCDWWDRRAYFEWPGALWTAVIRIILCHRRSASDGSSVWAVRFEGCLELWWLRPSWRDKRDWQADKKTNNSGAISNERDEIWRGGIGDEPVKLGLGSARAGQRRHVVSENSQRQ